MAYDCDTWRFPNFSNWDDRETWTVPKGRRANWREFRESEEEEAVLLSEMYYSQNIANCGARRVDTSCGPVSVANSMLRYYRYRHKVSPRKIICNAIKLKSYDQFGISPSSLRDLCKHMFAKEFTVELVDNCTLRKLAPGMLMFVRSVALLNAQSDVQFENPEHDSLVVMVEAVWEDGTVVVINPDRRQEGEGKGFQSGMWGRMKIPPAFMKSVWQTAQADGSTTVQTAISIISLHEAEQREEACEREHECQISLERERDLTPIWCKGVQAIKSGRWQERHRDRERQRDERERDDAYFLLLLDQLDEDSPERGNKREQLDEASPERGNKRASPEGLAWMLSP